ncbi:hypothetical protein LDBPK_220300, partial [Leishmania donovani]
MDAEFFPKNPVLRFDAAISAAYSRLLVDELKELQLILRDYTKLRLLQDREKRIRAAQLTAASRLYTSGTDCDQRQLYTRERPGCPDHHDSRVAKELFVDSSTPYKDVTPKIEASLTSPNSKVGEGPPLPQKFTPASHTSERLCHSGSDFPSQPTTCEEWKHKPFAKPYERLGSTHAHPQEAPNQAEPFTSAAFTRTSKLNSDTFAPPRPRFSGGVAAEAAG